LSWSCRTVDKTFCGLNSAQELIKNGQAAWDFSSLGYSTSSAGFVKFTGALSLKQIGSPSLAFAPIPTSAPNRTLGATSSSLTSTANSWQFRLDTWPQN
jgi:hypothetical protein